MSEIKHRFTFLYLIILILNIYFSGNLHSKGDINEYCNNNQNMDIDPNVNDKEYYMKEHKRLFREYNALKLKYNKLDLDYQRLKDNSLRN